MDAFMRHKYNDLDKLRVDFDDVNHDEVENVLDEMVDALNNWWYNR